MPIAGETQWVKEALAGPIVQDETPALRRDVKRSRDDDDDEMAAQAEVTELSEPAMARDVSSGGQMAAVEASKRVKTDDGMATSQPAATMWKQDPLSPVLVKVTHVCDH